MIQRHLLMHIYNPSPYLKGQSPSVVSPPYIPYAQLTPGVPGPRK